jgi:AcrR family transcriptional regulator
VKSTPPIKRRNAKQTRAKILNVAQDSFAEFGYTSTSIRDIAREADVASSLLSRYFGSKADLFEEALVNAFYTRGFFVRNRQRFGKEMAELIMSEENVPMTSMILLAGGDPTAREITKKIARDFMVGKLTEWLGPPRARARAINILAVMTGFGIYVHELNIRPIPRDSVIWLARLLQDIVDGK